MASIGPVCRVDAIWRADSTDGVYISPSMYRTPRTSFARYFFYFSWPGAWPWRALSSFFNFQGILPIHPYIRSRQFLCRMGPDELPILVIRKFSNNISWMFTKLVPSAHSEDTFKRGNVVKFIFFSEWSPVAGPRCLPLFVTGFLKKRGYPSWTAPWDSSLSFAASAFQERLPFFSFYQPSCFWIVFVLRIHF